MGRQVLVIGSGGREHALCLGMHSSPLVDKIYCSPGNAGTSMVANNITLGEDNDKIVKFCQNNDIDLVVVGPEAPLCAFLADDLIKNGIQCFGPVGELANLEGSKLHAKQIMQEVGVPTADFTILDNSTNIDAAMDAYSHNPWVIKRDVLAGGKGVVVTSNYEDAKQFITDAIKTDGSVLLEEFLPGEEASMLVVMDGSDFVCLPASQDHKRAYDSDLGPNTGGMGAYCPAPVVTESVHETVVKKIVKPMFDYLSKSPVPYRGVLYVGLMITDAGEPNVVEFNVRFGDPECQITLPLIKSDLFELLYHASEDRLSELDVEFLDAHALTIVLASEGYPSNPIKGREIIGIENSLKEVGVGKSWINFAGVASRDSTFLSSGGRVLSCSAMALNLGEAATLAYELIESIDLDGGFYRRDIGGKAL